MTRVAADPPAIKAPAALYCKLRFELDVPATDFQSYTTSVVKQALQNQYGWSEEFASISYALQACRVWLRSWEGDNERSLTVQFLDIAEGGVREQLSDYGANTRYPCVGYHYPNWMANTMIQADATPGFLRLAHNSTADRVCIVETSLKVVFYSATSPYKLQKPKSSEEVPISSSWKFLP